MSTATATAQGHDHIEIIDENLKWGFVQLPRLVLKAKGLSYRAKCLYCLLLDYAWQHDYCFPGQETLAADMDTSVDTIQRALQELREYGLISWKRQGLNKPNTYYILRLSECEKLRIVEPEQPKQDTANVPSQKPQKCGFQKPQSCGNKNTKSKETQFNEKDSSKITRSGADELTTPPPVTNASTNALHQKQQKREPTATGNAQTAARKPIEKAVKAERPPVFVGKPLTQDEIDEKHKQGKNASGYTPLANIPPEHWQRLEADARKAPIKPTATHYNNSTRNAPMFIDSIIEEFSTLLGDTENTAQNINRAAKLYRQSGLSEEEFRTLLYDSFNQAKRYPIDAIKKRRPDGRPNRMPVFFGILEDRAAAR